MVADPTRRKEAHPRKEFSMQNGRKLISEGHLIDTGLMSKYLDVVLENGGSYELIRFDIGRTVSDFSRVEMMVTAPLPEQVARILENLTALGCHVVEGSDQATVKPADRDGTVPDDFYSTTNHRTRVFFDGAWIDVDKQRMDAVIVLQRLETGGYRARCVKLRDVKTGDSIVCGIKGVQVFPPFREKGKMDFVFMNNEVSSERRVELVVAQLATAMKEIRARHGRTVVVVGPVVVHTGGSRHLGRLIRGGFVQSLLSGNAIGVHDVESAPV